MLSLFKTLTDDAALADDATNAVTKALAELGVFTDDEVIDFVKNLSDSAGVSEAHQLATTKPLVSIVANAEDSTTLFTKKAPDDFTFFGDTDYRFDFVKAPSDFPAALDAHAFDLSRRFSNAAGAFEVHSLGAGKVLFDQVTELDDYVLLFTKKAPDDTAAATDVITAFDFSKATVDIASALDVETLHFSKTLFDFNYANDDIDRLDTTKQLTSSVFVTDDVDGEASILDDQEMHFTKQRTDTASVGDLIYLQKGYVREFVETGVAASFASLFTHKSLLDGAATTESAFVLTGKQLYDIPAASDTAAKSLSRAHANNASAGDVTTRTAAKAVTDLASTADAGSLRSQGYADFTYFAEDYVGASRTF